MTASAADASLVVGHAERVPASSAARLRRALPRLTRDAVARMGALPWFAALPPDERSYVGLVVQAGLEEFVSWFRDPERPPTADRAIFDAAPRALARAVSLQQTVQLIRVAVEVLEAAIPSVAAVEDQDALEHAVLRYSREVAFAAAEVYAGAAEERGAWDARTEASVVDSLLRGDVGEAVLTRAGSLGWSRPEWATALAGGMPDADDDRVAALRSAARRTGLCLLVGDHGDSLLVVIGGSGDPISSIEQAAAAFPPGPVCVGPVVSELPEVVGVLAEARAALAAVGAWAEAPRPVGSGRLLAERVVLGDDVARRRLRTEVYEPLAARPELLATVSAYLDEGCAVEATARRLYLHANTVRYRLGRARDLVGRDATVPREAQELRLSLVIGSTGRG